MEVVVWLLIITSFCVMMSTTTATFYGFTAPQTALQRGAVCLDGTPASYRHFEGSGNGLNNWIVYLEHGGWCTSKDDCRSRTKGYSGTTFPSKGTQFYGIFNDNIRFNPDFYNWNKVYIHYCDGSSFMSDIEYIDPETKLAYRGARIYNVTMEELLVKGLGRAENAILAGSSAGGLATYLYCDKFRALLPNTPRVKCVADSGFFIHGNDLIGVELREKTFSDVVAIHELANSLPTTCTSKIAPAPLCLFPENLIADIKTPIFIIESAFDKYQITHHLLSPAADGYDELNNCGQNINLCNATQIQIMKDFRRPFIETLMKLNKSSSRGMFVHSCIRHMHIFITDGWIYPSPGNIVLANKTIGEAVGDWYFDRSAFNEIDTQRDSPWNCTINY